MIEFKQDTIFQNRHFDPTKIEAIKPCISRSWQIISPSWDLKNLIASNPLSGLEHLTFEQALIEGQLHFQTNQLPATFKLANRNTIKWCKALFDQGQAVLPAPLKSQGFYQAWRKLAVHDDELTKRNTAKMNWLQNLPDDSTTALLLALEQLRISEALHERFLKVLLTTLPGWAAHAKYQIKQSTKASSKWISQSDYLAVRAITLCLLVKDIVVFKQQFNDLLNTKISFVSDTINEITQREQSYCQAMMSDIYNQLKRHHVQTNAIKAQWVFCIDVRSEKMRRHLESFNHYQTFGAAGFFGLPISLHHTMSKNTKQLCPALIEPNKHLQADNTCKAKQKSYRRFQFIKRLFGRIKYSFLSSFAMVESLGILYGLSLIGKTLYPVSMFKLKRSLKPDDQEPRDIKVNLDMLSLKDKVDAAANTLKLIGLTDTFSKTVVICGHHSISTNNAFASYLQCGACGANPGSMNAFLLCEILNDNEVRTHLTLKEIYIPETTQFIAASHNTTSDEITLYPQDHDETTLTDINHIRDDLTKIKKYASDVSIKNQADWSQIRPEWGLAGNRAFIIGPRHLTKNIDLQGRVFLHSYDYDKDKDHQFLYQIMTAPLIVAHWINMQYFFSTLDNVSFGAGSKITHNVTGKIGVMQGNASDLMHGLPLESVASSDTQAYHKLFRLHAIVYAPRTALDMVIQKSEQLNHLCTNGWLFLVCIDPQTNQGYQLSNDGHWKNI